MKKFNYLFAVAALALASCSSDEIIESTDTSPNNEISFRVLTEATTRATAKTSFVGGDVINVFAEYKVGDNAPTKSFQSDFTLYDAQNFNSSTSYYWPSSMTGNKMIFTAFYGVNQSTTTAGSLAEAFTPNSAAASQIDILYARKEVADAPERPVSLTFYHMLSQVSVSVRNSMPSLKFHITGVRIGYLATSGTFAWTSTTLHSREGWTPAALTGTDVQKANLNKYEQTGLDFDFDNSTGNSYPITGLVPWMLIPQNFLSTKATGYAQAKNGSRSDDPELNGTYIAIKMSILNKENNAVIVPEQWCYWPIQIGINAGTYYDYHVLLSGGGYNPTDQNNSGTLFDVGDRVLDSPIEISSDCTINGWNTYVGANVP